MTINVKDFVLGLESKTNAIDAANAAFAGEAGLIQEMDNLVHSFDPTKGDPGEVWTEFQAQWATLKELNAALPAAVAAGVEPASAGAVGKSPMDQMVTEAKKITGEALAAAQAVVKGAQTTLDHLQSLTGTLPNV